MPIGVVGAKGFIGAYLTKYLLANNVGPLRLFVRTIPPVWDASAAEIISGDLLSRADCERFAAELKIIYYLAHTNSPINSDRDWPADALNNLLPLLNLLEAIKALKTKPQIVYFSSGGAVYAPNHTRIPYTEADLCTPTSSYGIQKLAAEHYLRLAAHQGYLTATALRVGNAYGTQLPENRLQGLIGVAIHNILHHRPIRLFGKLNNVRDYIHLDDICTIAEKVATPRHEFSILNVGTQTGHSVADVLRIIESCSSVPIRFDINEIEGRTLPEWVILNNSKAKEEFGWTPLVDLNSGISTMFHGLREEYRLGVGAD